MAIIVEDGTLIADANSYVSIADVDAYATSRGLVWTGDDAVKGAAILGAMDYIESKPFVGYVSTSTQLLQWPRSGAYANGWNITSDNIPLMLIKATCQATVDQMAGDMMPTLKRGGAIKRRKVDVLETEFFEGASATTKYSRVDILLAPLLDRSNRLVLA